MYRGVDSSLFEELGPARREPNADVRQIAVILRQFYNALQDEGFDDDDSMELVRELLRTTNSAVTLYSIDQLLDPDS